MAEFPIRLYEEGKVKFYAPDTKLYFERGSYIPGRTPVFYNPKMMLNRDIAVYSLQAYADEKKRGLMVCTPMAGCGVRAIRFVMETVGVKSIVINDINPRAVELIRKNLEFNKVKGNITVSCEDANALLSKYASKRERFDLIDLDPFGSPAPFTDSAIRALNPKGALLCITATDLAPLCGTHPRACLRKYGSKPLRVEYCHEVAVRILTFHSLSIAAKYDLALEPVLSHYAEHYVRIYFKCRLGARAADEKMRMIGYLLHCFSCSFRKLVQGYPTVFTHEECPNCGRRLEVAGPLWCGPIQNKEFVRRVAKIAEKEGNREASKVLRQILEEADAPPTYYNMHKLSSIAGVSCPPIENVIRRLMEKGFAVYRTHFSRFSIKTNASSGIILDTLRELALEKD